MENSMLVVDSNERHNLSQFNRVYSIIYGLLLILIGLFHYFEVDFMIFYTGLIVIGGLSFFYGMIGKEIFKRHNYLKVDSDYIIIKNSGEIKKSININAITYIKTIPFQLEITFNDYVKIFNLSWMTPEKFQLLLTRLDQISKENRFVIN